MGRPMGQVLAWPVPPTTANFGLGQPIGVMPDARDTPLSG